ncbi:hypothetical protein [Flagellimonas sp.]|uniref:hypothetical protein n=1 Tax=Flagellimonas sp. TaxID=2058762 RepID=UPI003BACEE63
MRQILYISTILFLLNSCNNEPKEKVTELNESSTPIETVDFDSDFNDWLTNQGLERKMIVDTTKERAFELWAYRDKLAESDSALYWYPSKDSSYYLITNFNRETNKRTTTEYSNDIELRFLKIESQEIFIGIMLLDSLKKRSIDFYWYDSTSFFFSENQSGDEEKILTKLEMGIDSIWTYKIEK